MLHLCSGTFRSKDHRKLRPQPKGKLLEKKICLRHENFAKKTNSVNKLKKPKQTNHIPLPWAVGFFFKLHWYLNCKKERESTHSHTCSHTDLNKGSGFCLLTLQTATLQINTSTSTETKIILNHFLFLYLNGLHLKVKDLILFSYELYLRNTLNKKEVICA